MLSDIERTSLLKKDLALEKINFTQKYSLKCDENFKWYSDKNNSIKRIYFSHKFLFNNNILEIVFRYYQLCFAKIKYFRQNINDYDYYKHNPYNGFIETDFWDIEFFRHKKSKKFIDLRYLHSITDINDFYKLIAFIETNTNFN